jgi:Skp family chaperone for outer membrane proteins
MKLLGNITLGLVALALCVGEAKAENAFEVKTVGVVDVKKIMDESIASKSAQKEVTAIKDKYFLEIKEQDKKLQARQQELVQQKKAMAPEAFNKEVMEFQSKIGEQKAIAQRKQKVIEAAFVKSLELIKQETVNVVKEVAKEKKLDMVVPTSQLLYSKDGIDITDEVLKRLNKKLTKVNINIKSDIVPQKR